MKNFLKHIILFSIPLWLVVLFLWIIDPVTYFGQNDIISPKYKDEVFYLKSSSIDIDFFVPEIQTVFQVAYSIKNISSQREITSLIEVAKSFNEAKQFVIITFEEEDSINIDNIEIKIIPIWKWLLSI